MTPVLWSDVQLAEAVSWFGVASHQPLVVIDGNLNATHYHDEIYQAHVIPFVQGQQRHITLQQDNAKPHIARVVMDFLVQ